MDKHHLIKKTFIVVNVHTDEIEVNDGFEHKTYNTNSFLSFMFETYNSINELSLM